MKKLIIGLVIGLILGMSTNAFAAISDTVSATFANFNYVVNGTTQPLGVTALVYDGTSYLKTTQIANMLGYDVTYKADSRTIEFNKPVTATPTPAVTTLAPAGSPTPTPTGATPSPTPSGSTPVPTPTPVGWTPSPTPVAAATPIPSATPAPSATPIASIAPAPTPYTLTNERMIFCNSLTDPVARELHGCN